MGRLAAARGRARAAARPAALGVVVGALVAAACAVVLFRHLQSMGGTLAPDARAFVREYVLACAGEAALVCLGIGAATGVAARYATGARGAGSARRLITAICGLWAGLAVASIYYSPTGLPDVGGLSSVPFAVPIGAGVAVAVVAGLFARVHWSRYVGVQVALATPMLAPDPGVGSPLLPVPPATGAPSVLLLGLDNVGRDGMRDLAARIAARARREEPARDPGVRLLADAISPVPVTRFAWGSVLLGRDPGTLFGLDTLNSPGRRELFAGEPFVLTRHATAAGYRTSFVTDEGSTNVFADGELFDTVRADALGWRVAVRWLVAGAFPFADGYVWRWRGVGIAGTPGGSSSWRVFRAISAQLATGDETPQLVAAHAVALHGPLRPTAAEAGGLWELLARTPGELQAEHPLMPGRQTARRSRRAVSQRALYERRRAALLERTDAYIAALTRAGHRERTLIVLFADHGELFLDDSTRNLPGLHGIQLDPTSVTTGAVALLPTGTRATGAAPPAASAQGVVAIRGSFPLQELGRIAAEFVRAAGDVDRHGRGTRLDTPWLAALARGDTLPARVVAVRSVGRPSLGGGPVEGGRRTLSDAEREHALRLWPDGRITFTAAAVERLRATSDLGWTDGEWLMSYVPLARGGHRVECYQRGKLVRMWTLIAAPPHPYAGGFVEREALSPRRGCAARYAVAPGPRAAEPAVRPQPGAAAIQ